MAPHCRFFKTIHLKSPYAYCLVFCALIFPPLRGTDLEKGFTALSIYDYFLAKKIFQQISEKKPSAAAYYGLAVIFSRQDNPFTNSDSAVKYVTLSFNYFRLNSQPMKFSVFSIDSASILWLAGRISITQFSKASKTKTVSALDSFLLRNYLGNKGILHEAIYTRDELEFNNLLRINNSDTTAEFIITHPQSGFHTDALLLKDRQVYDEMTVTKSEGAYTAFIKKNPHNLMVKSAYEKLFNIYRSNSDIKGLSVFVRDYPDALQNMEAWKLLFSLKAKSYTFSELKKFVGEHPDFPLKNSILKELELNKLELHPFQKGDFTGFINTKGNFVISPIYDAASDFSEGLSVVSKNDSVFFINKENSNAFGKVFSEASPFRNSIAPVKQHNKWFFINRLGQTVSKSYDEINEISNQTYVVKIEGKYGALDQYGQVILEPKFDKLGDFKNDLAYFIEKGYYGFVSRGGNIHKAEFEWISDFNDERIAIFRQNNKYGLINQLGKKILDAEYEQVIKTGYPVFIIVSNNNYGFFSFQGCFLTQVIYDYSREKPPEYYTNGKWFRLVKKSGQAFSDENGRLVIGFGAYDEINFPANGLIRVKQKNKYGYLDKKLGTAIPFKFAVAEDFSDSLAMVKIKDKYVMIDLEGNEVFSDKVPFEKLSRHYYLRSDETKSILNHKGEVIYGGVQNIQKMGERMLFVTLANEEIKFLYD